MKPKTPRFGVSAKTMAAAIAAVLIFAAVSAWAQDGQAGNPRAGQKILLKKVETTVTPSGQRVAIDPETKKIRPLTPEESQALSDALKNSAGKAPGEVRIYQYSNGMLSAELSEEYMDSLVVQRNADGTLSMECVRGTKAATALVESGIPVPQSETNTKSDGKNTAAKSGKPAPKPILEEKE